LQILIYQIQIYNVNALIGKLCHEKLALALTTLPPIKTLDQNCAHDQAGAEQVPPGAATDSTIKFSNTFRSFGGT
jgi:hypothetical protein